MATKVQIKHVGIYVGGGKVVHAPDRGQYVSYMNQYGMDLKYNP